MDCYVPESISGHDGDLRKLHPEACGVPFSPETPGTRRSSRLRNGKRSARFSGTVDATARKSDRHILRVAGTDGSFSPHLLSRPDCVLDRTLVCGYGKDWDPLSMVPVLVIFVTISVLFRGRSTGFLDFLRDVFVLSVVAK